LVDDGDDEPDLELVDPNAPAERETSASLARQSNQPTAAAPAATGGSPPITAPSSPVSAGAPSPSAAAAPELGLAPRLSEGRSRLTIVLLAGGALVIAAIALVLAVGRSTPQRSAPVYVVSNPDQDPTTGSSAAVSDAGVSLPTESVDVPPPRDASVQRPSRPPQPAGVAQRLTHAFGRQKVRVAACFQKHAGEVTGTPQVWIRIEVGTNGRANSAEIDPSSVGATALGKCLVGVVEATQWDHQDEPVVFRIPIKLKQK
jgi:hypothetical protein